MLAHSQIGREYCFGHYSGAKSCQRLLQIATMFWIDAGIGLLMVVREFGWIQRDSKGLLMGIWCLRGRVPTRGLTGTWENEQRYRRRPFTVQLAGSALG